MSAAYDDALRILTGTNPEYGGRTNHGSTVAMDLIEMDRPDAVLPWVQRYRHRLEGRQPIKKVLTRYNYSTALGVMGRASDWVAFFQRQLVERDWKVVLNIWMPRLAPGLAGAAGNGLLRVAHAVKSLEGGAGKLRKAELAEGLAYWAARYLNLPGIPAGAGAGRLTPVEALAAIKWQNQHELPEFGQISEGLRGLRGFTPFAGVINLTALPADPGELISRITEIFVRVFPAHREFPEVQIPFIKAVVIPSALRLLLPYLEPDTNTLLLRYTWQLAAALYAVFGRARAADSHDHAATDPMQLRNQAVATGNEFVIIFTAACLREYGYLPRPDYLLAAVQARELFTPQTQGSPVGIDPYLPRYKDQ